LASGLLFLTPFVLGPKPWVLEPQDQGDPGPHLLVQAFRPCGPFSTLRLF